MKSTINVEAALDHEGYGALAIGNPAYRRRGETVSEMLVSPGQAKMVTAINKFVAGVFRLLQAKETGKSAKKVLIRVEWFRNEEANDRHNS